MPNTVKPISLAPFIRTNTSRGLPLDTGLTVVSQDLIAIKDYLDSISGYIENIDTFTDVDPEISGISGTSLLAEPKVESGQLYNTTLLRPKTIKEVLVELQNAIDIDIGNTDVVSEFSLIKDKIGINVFNNSLVSDDTSIDKRVEDFEIKLGQLAADCFNRDGKPGDAQNTNLYNLTPQGGQTQEFSLRDMLDKLLTLHGGVRDVSHSDLGQKTFLTSMIQNDISGGDIKFSAPFSNSLGDTSVLSDKFYNPTSNTIKLDGLFCFIENNTLGDSVEIDLYINGVSTSLGIIISSGSTGSFTNEQDSIDLQEGSFVQFRIKAGDSSSGLVRIANITLKSKEILS